MEWMKKVNRAEHQQMRIPIEHGALTISTNAVSERKHFHALIQF
jgi:hypothetical protein